MYTAAPGPAAEVREAHAGRLPLHIKDWPVYPQTLTLGQAVRRGHTTRTILIRNEKLEFVDPTVFLGVTLDNKLQWCPHVRELVKRLRCSRGTDIIDKFVHGSSLRAAFFGRAAAGVRSEGLPTRDLP
ncbi:hypothetical protein EVAR_82818_1 [Eumeta japonica]|uniref:RNA-directed DNA polymerase from mobile element jockey n=1 Tax=Eumeta variegata TaxID=151549 RepID=A0A4C1V2I7_EUMVA|nr:hypothetical protein EVAR_82818_1 [Eumeta japonica]